VIAEAGKSVIAEGGNDVLAGIGTGALVGDDVPAPRSKAARIVAAIAKVVALAMAAFQLYTAITVSFSPMVQRSLHLAFALCLLYLVTPSRARAGGMDLALRSAAAALSVLVTVYAAVEFTNPGIFRAIDPTRLDIVFGTILVVLLLEATRRVAGASLAIIALIFMVYAFVGPWLPGLLGHPGSSTRKSCPRCTSASRASSAPRSGERDLCLCVHPVRRIHDPHGRRRFLHQPRPGAPRTHARRRRQGLDLRQRAVRDDHRHRTLPTPQRWAW
jgi:hypothetical protein